MNTLPNGTQPPPGLQATRPAPSTRPGNANTTGGGGAGKGTKSSNTTLLLILAGVGCLGIMGFGTLMVGIGAFAWYQSAQAAEEEDALARLYANEAYDPYGAGEIDAVLALDEPTNRWPSPGAAGVGGIEGPADPVRYLPVGDSPIQGPADALVTIVAFGDYQCPFCDRVLPTLAQVQATYGDDVRIVYKNNPLPFHQNAMPSAELALEARAQRGDAGFFQAHEALYASQDDLSRANLERIAGALGLNLQETRRALDSHRHRATIERDIELAASVEATGTPSFFINGRVIRGAQPYEAFAQVIDQERAMARLLVASGVAQVDVYETVVGDARR